VATSSSSIGSYEHCSAKCRDYDPRSADVARQVAQLIVSEVPGCTVEHVGSTSVPGLAGKGVIDLMLLYPPGHLARARDALDRLGFQRQSGRDPFPEDRPMRTGSFQVDGERFLLHVHVIAADAPEASVLRAFRDRLRADAALREQYVARKRAIIADGVTDTLEYCYRKGGFIEDVLRSQRLASYPERLKTAHLVLTRPTVSDGADLNAMHNDPRVMATLGGLRTPEELEASNQRLLACWTNDGFGWWVARDGRDGQFVGRGGLRRIQIEGRDEVELGYGLAAEFWGRGLAGEIAEASMRAGFELLGLGELVCFTLPTNTRSRRVMEKAGFRYERDGAHAGLPHVFYRLRCQDWRPAAYSAEDRPH
jgi:[ribosomal protein S5]-alanine N-acetyltransferase